MNWLRCKGVDRLNDYMYKNIILLIYMNTVNDLYTYQEISSILGFTIEQSMETVESLIGSGYLGQNEKNILYITDFGFQFLKEQKVENVKINDLYSSSKSFQKHIIEKRAIDDIYIPEDFDKKFKGYL